MEYTINASAGCDRGRKRLKNEDNLYFDGKILSEEHKDLSLFVMDNLRTDAEPIFGVFDGMGGEERGETASYIAASTTEEFARERDSYQVYPGDFLRNLCREANLAVCDACDELEEGRMGSTIVMLYFTADEVYCCNMGDSKGFRYRNNVLQQITKDHVELQPPRSRQKPAITQYLGVYPEELTLVPYIAKANLKRGDIFLICSDGLTDVLSTNEISDAIKESISPNQCVERLIMMANEKGGRDNITIILCRID